jgi:hypothetical protein
VTVGYAAAMVDSDYVLLVQACEDYLTRRQQIVDQTAAFGYARPSTVAMDAAADQLARAVTVAWKDIREKIIQEYSI